ncbi:Gas vesicle protein [Enhydrobacter aerosaccus]|uniref:Gas vesicle protein n=1 Tax=Enhydrobacter aerosaccus TaxID=225324 RepID=A0A1T4LV68_9HYPH|nr:gas vesicle protein [Enhydrobacter aerosaccus]SJZ58640.1 Gas vesicle protein [Enhydrobacter aerosaccus]
MAVTNGRMEHSIQGSSLADILDRILDKGIVIAGDVTISLVGVELLNIRLRLLVASVDKAIEMGINWWEADPYLTSQTKASSEQTELLQQRLERIEGLLAGQATKEQPL